MCRSSPCMKSGVVYALAIQPQSISINKRDPAFGAAARAALCFRLIQLSALLSLSVKIERERERERERVSNNQSLFS